MKKIAPILLISRKFFYSLYHKNDIIVKKNLTNQSISEISRLIHTQKISPLELVKGCIKKIKELNHLNAVITTLEDRKIHADFI